MANQSRVALSFLAVLVALAAVPAQCGLVQAPGPMTSGPGGGLTVLQSGDIVAAMQFPTTVGYQLQRWDGSSWSMLGAANGEIFDVVELPNGDIVIGGEFTAVGASAALGVTAFELLTGRVPFKDGNIPYHHVHTPPPDVRELREDVPESVARLVARCLEKDAAERYQTARDILVDVRAILTG